MGRAKKTDDEDRDNRDIGDRLARLRSERGLSQAKLAKDLGISAAQLNALEAGRHSFTASFVMKLAKHFEVSVTRLLGLELGVDSDSVRDQWMSFYDSLPKRDRVVLHDLASRLSNWPRTFSQQLEHPPKSGYGRLISIEGIDGVLLRELGNRLAHRLTNTRIATHCWYDYDSELWKHLMHRLKQLDIASRDPAHVFERTMLFACERLYRQEVMIRRRLEQDNTVLTPFFALAAGVYQEMEGVSDYRIIDIVEGLLVKPDLILLVKSDPHVAAARAVKGTPNDNNFYSPYGPEELTRAQRLYAKAAEQFSDRGHLVHQLECTANEADDALVESAALEIQKYLLGDHSS